MAFVAGAAASRWLSGCGLPTGQAFTDLGGDIYLQIFVPQPPGW
jgi:hypothetical protein